MKKKESKIDIFMGYFILKKWKVLKTDNWNWLTLQIAQDLLQTILKKDIISILTVE